MRGRPINPTSMRQLKPWQALRVSRTTYYMWCRTLREAGFPPDTAFHPEFVERLRRMAFHNRLTFAEVAHHLVVVMGQSPTDHVGRYISYREAQEMDEAKRRRTRGARAEQMRHTMEADPATCGELLTVDEHRAARILHDDEVKCVIKDTPNDEL